MSNAMLYAEISSLPDNLKSEVADFVAFLKQKHQRERKSGNVSLVLLKARW